MLNKNQTKMPATCRLLINFGAKSLEFKGVYKLSELRIWRITG